MTWFCVFNKENTVIKAVLFDLDGTLVDSIPDLTVGINTLMHECGREPFTERTVSTFVGKGVRALIERVLFDRKIEATPETVDSYVDRYASIMLANNNRYSTFYPGALESIERLREAGYKTALVTNKMRRMTMGFIEQKQIGHLFDTIVAGDDTAHPKPCGDMLEKATAELGMSVDEAVMVGDSCNDALAARAAGMDVYLVRTGYNEGEPIDDWARENGFNFVFDNLGHMLEKTMLLVNAKASKGLR